MSPHWTLYRHQPKSSPTRPQSKTRIHMQNTHTFLF
uniref:Uncharacterized protein n=1 Tax=Anguilla anguilla TaxID=7936 RepID=A0A0E9XYK3_ANGAN